MPEYPLTSLGELASSDRYSISIGPFGSKMKADTYVEAGIPVIRGANIGNDRRLEGDWVYIQPGLAATMPNCILQNGDLVFPHRGAIGEVALIEGITSPIFLSSSMMKFRPDPEKLLSRFAYYYFRSDAGRAEIMRFASSVGTPGIGQPLASLRQFSIPLPDIQAQFAIANVLSSLDDKIELNRRMNETLEGMAQAIFRDWFVDFGPVRRRMDGATDPVAILGGLIPAPDHAAELAALFPNTLGSDGLPVGWSSATVDQLVEFNPRETLKKGEPAPYTDMASLPTQGSTAESPVFREFSSGMKFRNGDALLGRITPCLENGKSAFVDFLPAGSPVGWGSTEFIVMRSRDPVPKPFAHLLNRWPDFRAAAIQSMTGTSGRQRASEGTLRGFEFVRATNAVYLAFGELIGPMYGKISGTADENRTLADTRDFLLPRLMSGKVRVADAERMAG